MLKSGFSSQYKYSKLRTSLDHYSRKYKPYLLTSTKRYLLSSYIRWNENESSPDTRKQQIEFLRDHKERMALEQLIYEYSRKPLKTYDFHALTAQSQELSSPFLLQNAKDTIEELLKYNAKSIRAFRALPYLVLLNPSISESYRHYLQTTSALLMTSVLPPKSLEENEHLVSKILDEFIGIHADSLPSLSKGFAEVVNLMTVEQVKDFLDRYLKDRILMRMVAHQHVELSKTIRDETQFVPGSKYNGLIKPLNMIDVINKGADLVNDILLMESDQTVSITIDSSLPIEEDKPIIFPYIEYQLDYVLIEIFKNAFRSQIENRVSSPVEVTVSLPSDSSYLEMRIRDRGKGIPPKVLPHIFDYSFTTWESTEGDSYKTLNLPPGMSAKSLAGVGYGLPLLRHYIEIFNNFASLEDKSFTHGLLTVQSYLNWGTDVYIKLKC